jgi:hypothetical protein
MMAMPEPTRKLTVKLTTIGQADQPISTPMIKRSVLFYMTYILLTACLTYGCVSELTAQERAAVLGKWSALSEVYIATNGDMEILKDRVFWEKHGSILYRIVEQKEDVLLVELEREVGCGRYVRIGPISNSRLEVAFYRHQEDLQKPKRPKSFKKDELEYEHGCLWGLYVK